MDLPELSLLRKEASDGRRKLADLADRQRACRSAAVSVVVLAADAKAVEKAVRLRFAWPGDVMLRCKGNGKRVVVTLAGKAQASAMLHAKPPITLSNAILQVITALPRDHEIAMKDLDIRITYPLTCLQVGFARKNFIVKWQSMKACAIVLDLNAPERPLTLTLTLNGNDYRLEWALSDVSIRSLRDDRQRTIVRLQAERPPFAYRRVSSKWDRTTDPTSGDGAFGHYISYRLVLAPGVPARDEALLANLSNLGLMVGAVGASKRLRVCSTPQIRIVPSPMDDFTCGFNVVFEKALRPSTLYLLHALSSSHRIEITSEAEALQVCKVLQQVDPVTVEAHLACLFYGRRLGGAAVQQLLQRLARIKDKVDPIDDDRFCPGARMSNALGERRLETDLIQRVLITPLRTCVQPADVGVTNRILRQYAEHKTRFMRVTFVDEDFGSVVQARSEDVISGRIRNLLRDGVVVAGRRYVFLAFANSQLRDAAAWFYDEEPHYRQARPPSADQIRASNGDLTSINVVGKYAARLGQSLSQSIGTVQVAEGACVHLADVIRNGFCFSDGAGIISARYAVRMSSMLELPDTPSAFQIRIGGCKGVVCVAPEGVLARGVDLVLRPSLVKYQGKSNILEVLACARPMTFYLNRQTITVLSALGVRDESFLSLVRGMVAEIDGCASSNEACLRMLRRHRAEHNGRRMLEAGVDVGQDRHLRDLIMTSRMRLLLDLKLKARILVDDAVCLIGVMDETLVHCVPEGSVFFQYTVGNETRRLPPGTRVAVGRSPSIHPGDIRVLSVVDCPELDHLVDVIVFPAIGHRPHANEMSGGDLDGDIFFAIWARDLVPACSVGAMDYEPPAPLPPRTTPITITDVQDFFVEFLKNDRVGQIANAHLVLSDQSRLGVRDPRCLRLAQLHSIAVDYAKSGVAARMPRDLYPNAYPSFMDNPRRLSYQSRKVLGEIHRIATGAQLRPLRALPGRERIDARLVVPGHDHYMAEAIELMEQYNRAIWELMLQYGVFDEGELLSGYVLSFSRESSRSRQKGYDAQERLSIALSSTRRAFLAKFWKDLDPDLDCDAVNQKASAWYIAAYSLPENVSAPPLLSFAWIAIDPLTAILDAQRHL